MPIRADHSNLEGAASCAFGTRRGVSESRYRQVLIDELMDIRWGLHNTDLGDLLRAAANPIEGLLSRPGF